MSFYAVLAFCFFYYTLIIKTVDGVCPDDNKFVFYTNPSVTAPIRACPIAKDCKVWYDAGVRKSGIYPINPDGKGPFQVYCDMETDGGGWTVFQRRQDGTVDFFNNQWSYYERGFGSLDGEFWLGLSKIHRLTPDGDNELRVDLKDFDGNAVYAHYNEFEVLDSHTQYMLVVTNYTGTAGDSLSFHNLMKFSSKDNDNDIHETESFNCALHDGPWWHKNCFEANLNGIYVSGGTTTSHDGTIWKAWKGYSYSLKFTEMKVRSVS